MKQKIAICIEGGMVVGIRSNISADIEVEILDDNDMDSSDIDNRWELIQKELEFGNYKL